MSDLRKRVILEKLAASSKTIAESLTHLSGEALNAVGKKSVANWIKANPKATVKELSHAFGNLRPVTLRGKMGPAFK